MKQFLVGLISGFVIIILLIACWMFLFPHSLYESDLTSQVIVLGGGEKVIFTYDNGCVNTDEPDSPVLTYIRNNGQWISQQVPEGFMFRDDEYILTTSSDKSEIYLLLPRRDEGFLWNLFENRFELIHDISDIKSNRIYVHENP